MRLSRGHMLEKKTVREKNLRNQQRLRGQEWAEGRKELGESHTLEFKGRIQSKKGGGSSIEYYGEIK